MIRRSSTSAMQKFLKKGFSVNTILSTPHGDGDMEEEEEEEWEEEDWQEEEW